MVDILQDGSLNWEVIQIESEDVLINSVLNTVVEFLYPDLVLFSGSGRTINVVKERLSYSIETRKHINSNCLNLRNFFNEKNRK